MPPAPPGKGAVRRRKEAGHAETHACRMAERPGAEDAAEEKTGVRRGGSPPSPTAPAGCRRLTGRPSDADGRRLRRRGEAKRRKRQGRASNVISFYFGSFPKRGLTGASGEPETGAPRERAPAVPTVRPTPTPDDAVSRTAPTPDSVRQTAPVSRHPTPGREEGRRKEDAGRRTEEGRTAETEPQRRNRAQSRSGRRDRKKAGAKCAKREGCPNFEKAGRKDGRGGREPAREENTEIEKKEMRRKTERQTTDDGRRKTGGGEDASRKAGGIQSQSGGARRAPRRHPGGNA